MSNILLIEDNKKGMKDLISLLKKMDTSWKPQNNVSEFTFNEDEIDELINNRLFKRLSNMIMGGAMDSIQVIKMTGDLRVPKLKITKNTGIAVKVAEWEKIFDSVKYPEWGNICDSCQVIIDT